jgi:uncharacterized membrane protein required for colicin V production
MGWNGEDGAQGASLDLMGWVSGNTFVKVSKFLGAISNLILARALGFVFGRIFGVGIELSKRPFLTCLAWLALKGHL